jgi:hypothetical protein
MAKQSRTKEENFILTIYKLAKAAGDLSRPYDRYTIGTALGLTYRVVDPLCNILLQSNFLKKEEENSVYLTSRGIELAERLLDEKPS